MPNYQNILLINLQDCTSKESAQYSFNITIHEAVQIPIVLLTWLWCSRHSARRDIPRSSKNWLNSLHPSRFFCSYSPHVHFRWIKLNPSGRVLAFVCAEQQAMTAISDSQPASQLASQCNDMLVLRKGGHVCVCGFSKNGIGILERGGTFTWFTGITDCINAEHCSWVRGTYDYFSRR